MLQKRGGITFATLHIVQNTELAQGFQKFDILFVRKEAHGRILFPKKTLVHWQSCHFWNQKINRIEVCSVRRSHPDVRTQRFESHSFAEAQSSSTGGKGIGYLEQLPAGPQSHVTTYGGEWCS